MSELLMYFALSLMFTVGPMLIPAVVSLVGTITHSVRKAGGTSKAGRVRRVAPVRAV